MRDRKRDRESAAYCISHKNVNYTVTNAINIRTRRILNEDIGCVCVCGRVSGVHGVERHIQLFVMVIIDLVVLAGFNFALWIC